MDKKEYILKSLNDVQKNICKSEKNFILIACPGSGKTRVITHRLAYIVASNENSQKLNIALTYTNRAAKEIEKRIDEMNINTSSIWTGTIHQFCLNFIIRPYSMYDEYLSKGYKIIDEYVEELYYKKIAEELNVKYKYVNELYENEIVISEFKKSLIKNKEINFDMILELSLKLLTNHNFISENISNIIRSIHVDEYQDTNEKQYLILSELIKSNLNINILFVGDINQAIYSKIGGIAKSSKEIKELFPINFEEITMSKCYRSTQRIIDYYSHFELFKTNSISNSNDKDDVGTISYNFNITKENLAFHISKIIKDKLNEGLPEYEICIVAPQWQLMFPIANKLRELLPNNNFDAPDISPIKYDPLNPFYLIAKLLFTKNSKYTSLRRKEAKEILSILIEDYRLDIPDYISNLDVLKILNKVNINKNDALKTIDDAFNSIIKVFKLENEKNFIESKCYFIQKINERMLKYEFSNTTNIFENSFKEKNGIVISTLHGIKGEEYNTVIGYGLLTGYVPHWNYIYKSILKSKKIDESKKLLYVLCSRAKKHLFLFSETGRKTKTKNDYEPTDEIKKVSFLYD